MQAVTAESIVERAAAAVRGRDSALIDTLDALAGAVYVTDASGAITHFNKACIELAGRVPTVNQDRWCVTWRLYTTSGKFVPHDQCPLAVAVREKRAVRGEEAVAERPDGTRFSFTPYPTPIFDADGVLIGAVNLLVDTSRPLQAQALRDQAARCRRLSDAVNDKGVIATLRAMAVEYDARAREIDQPH